MRDYITTRPWRIMLETSCIMLCQHFLDVQLLCFLYKPHYAHIMLGYVLRSETHATCSSEECTFCSDVDDATKAESTVASYPGLGKMLKVQLLILTSYYPSKYTKSTN